MLLNVLHVVFALNLASTACGSDANGGLDKKRLRRSSCAEV